MTSEEIEEVTTGDFSQVETPSEALGVTEEDIAAVDEESIAKSESFGYDHGGASSGEGYWELPGDLEA
jgi:hypothetical protein